MNLYTMWPGFEVKLDQIEIISKIRFLNVILVDAIAKVFKFDLILSFHIFLQYFIENGEFLSAEWS